MVIKGEERRGFVRAAAAQCVVLLKNEGGALPLPQCRVAVFGIGQIRTVKGGTGSGEVNNVSNVSILDGLRACPVLTVYEPLAAKYEEYDRAHPQPVKQFPQVADPSSPEMPLSAETAADAAAHADAAIVVISRVAGEGGDRKIARGDYLLQQAEVNEISTVCDAFAEKPVKEEKKKGCSGGLNHGGTLASIAAVAAAGIVAAARGESKRQKNKNGGKK